MKDIVIGGIVATIAGTAGGAGIGVYTSVQTGEPIPTWYWLALIGINITVSVLFGWWRWKKA